MPDGLMSFLTIIASLRVGNGASPGSCSVCKPRSQGGLRLRCAFHADSYGGVLGHSENLLRPAGKFFRAGQPQQQRKRQRAVPSPSICLARALGRDLVPASHYRRKNVEGAHHNEYCGQKCGNCYCPNHFLAPRTHPLMKQEPSTISRIFFMYQTSPSALPGSERKMISSRPGIGWSSLLAPEQLRKREREGANLGYSE